MKKYCREKCPRPFFVHDHYGNAEIHMRTESPPRIVWCASLRSEEEKVPEAIFVNGCHGNVQIHIRTKFQLHALYGLRSEEVVVGKSA